MASLEETFADDDYKNWMKAVLSLHVTRDGILQFVKTNIDSFHQKTLSKLPTPSACNTCTTQNIVLCQRNNDLCKYEKRKCRIHDPSDPSKRNMQCILGVCDIICSEIRANHRHLKPQWTNTDARQWCGNSWQLAVCYMPEGYANSPSADQTDISVLLSIIINNKYFENAVQEDLSLDDNAFRRAKTTRNAILHNAVMRLTNIELQEHVTNLTSILTDTKCLSSNQNAQDAIKKLKQIMTDPLNISKLDELKMTEEAIKALDDIKEQGDKASEAIDDKKTQALQHMDEAEVKVLESTEVAKGNALREIERITVASVAAIDEKKAEVYDDLCYGKKTREYKSRVKDLQRELVSLYKSEKYLTTPLYPLKQRGSKPIGESYVKPLMRTVVKESIHRKTYIPIESFEGVFLDSGKNIYVVGDAGMGKSALCKKMLSGWCKCQAKEYTYDTLTADQQTMGQFDFVFHISLRDCTGDSSIMEMIEHEILVAIPGYNDIVQTVLKDSNCLILLDGLDEWTAPAELSRPSSNICSSIPGKQWVRNCTIVTTTRPWKLEAIRFEHSEIDKHIELLGIDQNSSHKLIQYILTNLNSSCDSKKATDKFVSEMNKKELDHFLNIPVILKQLVCVWQAGHKLRDTKSSLYSQMMNLLLELSQSRLKESYKDIIEKWTKSAISLPTCFAEDTKCIEFRQLLYTLSQLAFEILFSENPETSLVFETSEAYLHGLTKDELGICLKIGIISQSEFTVDCVSEHTKISFLHKSYQEFLAALWISISKIELEKYISIFKGKCSTVQSIFELSEFILFVGGMNSDIACKLSVHTRSLISQYDIAKLYRNTVAISMCSLLPGNDYEVRLLVYIKRLQTNIVNCMKEGWNCQHDQSHYYLEDIIISLDTAPAMTERLLYLNRNNIKSIAIETQPSDTCVEVLKQIRGLEKLHSDFSTQSDITQQLLVNSKESLVSLSLGFVVFENVIISRDLPHLVNIRLSDISLSHAKFSSLMSYLSKAKQMKKIHLNRVVCRERLCKSHVLDLKYHDQLVSLELAYVLFNIAPGVNTAILESCVLYHIESVTSVDHIIKDIGTASNLRHAEIGYYTKPETVSIVEFMSSFKKLQRLALWHINFGQNCFALSDNSHDLACLHMNFVTMTKRTFRGLIDSLLRTKTPVEVCFIGLDINPHADINDILDNVRHSRECLVTCDDVKRTSACISFFFKTVKYNIKDKNMGMQNT